MNQGEFLDVAQFSRATFTLTHLLPVQDHSKERIPIPIASIRGFLIIFVCAQTLSLPEELVLAFYFHSLTSALCLGCGVIVRFL